MLLLSYIQAGFIFGTNLRKLPLNAYLRNNSIATYSIAITIFGCLYVSLNEFWNSRPYSSFMIDIS